MDFPKFWVKLSIFLYSIPTASEDVEFQNIQVDIHGDHILLTLI